MKFDKETASYLFHAIAEILVEDFTKPDVVRVDENIISTHFNTGTEVHLTPPSEDGKGPWKLFSWKESQDGKILAHWSRTLTIEVPSKIEATFGDDEPSDEAKDETTPPQP